jgi:ABC-type molybdate transport system permease subunit
MMELEFWMVILTCACAVIPWAFSIHAKVAVIASAVQGLPEVVDELRDILREHEHRLDEHASKIQTLQETTKLRR